MTDPRTMPSLEQTVVAPEFFSDNSGEALRLPADIEGPSVQDPSAFFDATAIATPTSTYDLATPPDLMAMPAVGPDQAAHIPGADAPYPADIYTAISAQVTDMLELGGPVVTVLGLLSIFALTIVLLKLWQFFRLGLGQHRRMDKAIALWCEREPEDAIKLLEGRRQPVARVAHLAMTGLHSRSVDQGTLREEVVRVASNQLESLRSYLRALEVIATLSPLLGLLGTVLGMIQAFQQLEVAGTQVDPTVLSGGIWQALLTTAIGLTVAIPVVLSHTWLERKVERCQHAMEDAATRVFTRALTPVPRRPLTDTATRTGYAT